MFEQEICNNSRKINNVNYLVDMPKLYDFVYSKVFNYELRSEIIENHMNNPSEITILGCGSGLLINHLEDYTQIIAVDKDQNMLDLCKRRNQDCHIIQKDIISDLDIDYRNNNVILLGNVSGMFTENQMNRLFQNVSNYLGSSGNFILDFISEESTRKNTKRKIKSSLVEVTRTERYSKDEDDNLKSYYSYNINFEDSSYNFEERFTMRTHSLESLKNSLSNVGFDKVFKIENSEYKHTLLSCSI